MAKKRYIDKGYIAYQNRMAKMYREPRRMVTVWLEYGAEKRKLQALNLPSAKYEQAIRELAERLKV
jgi:hypothetical protein